MDLKLLISIIVLDLALYTSQVSCQVNLTRDYDPDCIIEGTVITLTCTVEDRNNGHGVTLITGSQVIFDCPSNNTVENNRLYLNHVHAQSARAICGDFVSGQIMEVENGIYISKITITTTIAMNGGYVECSELGQQDRQQIQLANIKEMSQECLRDGEPASYTSTIELMRGTLEWIGSGVGFICPDVVGSLSDNRIRFDSIENCPTSTDPQYRVCGPYNASLVCNIRNESQVSKLLFVTNYTLMNGGTLFFQEFNPSVPDDVFRNITVRVGVTPDPPEHANLTFPLKTVCRYDWVPPNGNVIGSIRGYNLNYGGDCGICSPIGMVNSSTFTALCSGWIPNGQTCYFEVRTVTEDCEFLSTPANVTSILVDTFPSDIEVVVDCSQDVDSPQIHVTWNYSPPEVENTTIIPGVLGFLVTIYDGVSNNYSKYLNNSGARAYSFNSSSPEFQNASLEGSIRFINVTVETEVGNFSNNISNQFSVNGTMADISSTLTTKQCVAISINQWCNESADSFQAQLQFADGACQKNIAMNTTQNNTLQHDYETCIPVGTDPICFSAVIFHRGVEVARTVKQELILLQCNTSYISSVYNNGVTVTNSTTIGVVPQGTKVLHNTVLSVQCTNLCKLMGTNTTRCVNGTFESLLNESSHCDCGQQLTVGLAVGLPLLGLVPLVIADIIICRVIIKRKQVYAVKKVEAKGEKIQIKKLN